MDRRILFATVPVLAVLAVLWWPRGPDPIELSEAGVIPPPDPVLVTVHVAGWVANPGLVSLPEGSRAADALAAAGGVVPGGDASGLNLAEPLVDGVRIHVPGPGSEPALTEESDAPVPVNRATSAELAELPGIGPVLAGRIVAHRDRNGPFRTVEDLLDVSGIGERTLADLRDLVTVP